MKIQISWTVKADAVKSYVIYQLEKVIFVVTYILGVELVTHTGRRLIYPRAALVRLERDVFSEALVDGPAPVVRAAVLHVGRPGTIIAPVRDAMGPKIHRAYG